MKRGLKISLMAAFVTVVVLVGTQAMAGSIALTLNRTSIGNIADAVGYWQHERGTIVKGSTLVGYYIVQRRFSYSYAILPTTITLTFNNTAAYNVTLQGDTNLSTNQFYGSVSATSNRYAFLNGGDAQIPGTTATPKTLYLYWNGSNQLTLP